MLKFRSGKELKEYEYLCSTVFATCLGVLLLRTAQTHTGHVEHNSWRYLVFILANQKTAITILVTKSIIVGYIWFLSEPIKIQRI